MIERSCHVDSSRPVVVSRRVAIGAAVCSLLALTAACGRNGSADSQAVPGTSPGTTGGSGPTLNRDLRLLTAAIAQEEELGSFFASAARRFPTQRPLLTGLVERQRLHVARFRSALSNLDPPVSQVRPSLPRKGKDVLSAVGDHALDARDARTQDCVSATSGLLAELFASASASHAVTVQAASPKDASTTVSVPSSVSPPAPLQPCLAAEHAAVYGYGLLAGVLSAGVSDTPPAQAALASYHAHRDRRDALTELIGQAGAEPVASEPVYDTPFVVAGLPTARRLARYLEASCATVYARATAVTTDDVRLMVSGTLLDCAVRGARWGAPPLAFPGLDAV